MARSSRVLIGGATGAVVLGAVGGFLLGADRAPGEATQHGVAAVAGAGPGNAAPSSADLSHPPTAEADESSHAGGREPERTEVTVEHASAGQAGPTMSTTWVVPVTDELLDFPVSSDMDAGLVCTTEPGGLLDCSAPPARPLCTEEQSAWLAERAVPEEEFMFSEEGQVWTGDLLLRNTSTSQGAAAIDSVRAEVAFTPSSEEYVLIACAPYPSAAGGAGAPSMARAVQVPLTAGPVVFGEQNPYGDAATMQQPAGTPVAINLQRGDTARIQPRISVPAAGQLSGRLTMTVGLGSAESTVEAPILGDVDRSLVVPVETPRIFVQAGTLCGPSTSVEATDHDPCTMEAVLQRKGLHD